MWICPRFSQFLLLLSLSLSCLLSLPSTPPPLPSLHIVGHGRAYFTRFTRLNSLELTGRKSLLGARQPAGSYVNFILLSASWINLSLFQPSYIFTSIQNGDAFKRETHKCQREGGVRGYEFETPVPNIYLDEKELFSQRTFEFFTACTKTALPSLYLDGQNKYNTSHHQIESIRRQDPNNYSDTETRCFV